jgi:hypothetical protein
MCSNVHMILFLDLSVPAQCTEYEGGQKIIKVWSLGLHQSIYKKHNLQYHILMNK